MNLCSFKIWTIPLQKLVQTCTKSIENTCCWASWQFITKTGWILDGSKIKLFSVIEIRNWFIRWQEKYVEFSESILHSWFTNMGRGIPQAEGSFKARGSFWNKERKRIFNCSAVSEIVLDVVHAKFYRRLFVLTVWFIVNSESLLIDFVVSSQRIMQPSIHLNSTFNPFEFKIRNSLHMFSKINTYTYRTVSSTKYQWYVVN